MLFLCYKLRKLRLSSERSELRYRVQGVANSVVYPLSRPRGWHWEGFKASGMVKVDAPNVLH